MAGEKKAVEGGSTEDAKTTAATGKKDAASPEVVPAPATRMKSMKIPKLAKKNKSRLPRRQKKALRKAGTA
jgi:hypothetical protein